MSTQRSSSMKAQLRNGFPKTVSNLIENLKTITEDELDQLAEAGDIDLVHNVPWRPGMTVPELPGGWTAIYTGKQYDGAEGIIILLPKSPWNRKLWNRGQIKKAIEANMTEFQAALFMASRIKFKMEMMKIVGSIVNNERLLEVYRSWRHTFTKDENMRWEARNSIHDNLSPVRRRELQAVLREITQPTEEQVWAAQRLLDSIRPADEPVIPEAEVVEETKSTESAKEEDEVKSGKTEAQRAAARLRWKRWRTRQKQKRRERRDAEENSEASQPLRGETVGVVMIDESPYIPPTEGSPTMEEVYQEKGPEGLMEELVRQNPEQTSAGDETFALPAGETTETAEVPPAKKKPRKRRIDVSTTASE